MDAFLYLCLSGASWPGSAACYFVYFVLFGICLVYLRIYVWHMFSYIFGGDPLHPVKPTSSNHVLSLGDGLHIVAALRCLVRGDSKLVTNFYLGESGCGVSAIELHDLVRAQGVHLEALILGNNSKKNMLTNVSNIY